MVDFVEITTGSRLHFGPLFCGRTSGRRFGGVGVMIDRPACRVTVRPVATVTRPWGEGHEDSHALTSVATAGHYEPGVSVEVHESIPRHRGLGSGTQTALAVAQGIHVLRHGEPADAATLARKTGRGQRSAVGIHGFQHGGFLIDAGKREADSIGALAARCDVPEDWRFVLIAPATHEAAGLFGSSEREAFARLPAMPDAASGELCRLALTELLPAARDADFPAFADALFEYGRIVGEFFAPVQGGCFAHPEMARLAATLRNNGIRGVAQSSWGPTIAVVTQDDATARELAANTATGLDILCEVSPPRNRGATVESPSA